MIRRLLCRILGHRWGRFWASAPRFTREGMRVCRRCDHTETWKWTLPGEAP